MTHGLANVFVNNQRVEDLDEPTLRVRDLVQAYGREPDKCIVYKLRSEDDTQGEPLGLDETVDLAEQRGPLFLRCETRRTEATAPADPSRPDEAKDWSTADAGHRSGDPTGHQVHEREEAPRREGQGESVPPASNRPSALGSELRERRGRRDADERTTEANVRESSQS